MSMNFSKLGEQKITVPAILLIGLVWLGWNARELTVSGLDKFFFTDLAAAELTDAVAQNTAVLTSYIQRQEIRDVNDQLEQVSAQVTETQLWIAANGENPIATARLADLVKRRRKFEDQRSCLLNDNIENKENCDA